MKRPFSKLPKALRGFMFFLIQWTWGLPQNLFGAFVSLFLRGERFRYHGALVTVYRRSRLVDNRSGFSLGTFIFMPESWNEQERKHLVVHEYGHSVQSLFLGPLYFFVVAIPSVIWCSRFTRNCTAYWERGIGYTDRFPENQADKLGERVTGEKPQ